MIDQVEVELAIQPLLDDLEMQEPEKAAAKAEAQGAAALGLVLEAGIVEPELAEAVAQILVVRRIDREHAAEDHRLRRPEAGQRRGRGPLLLGDRVADPGVRDVLDRGGDEADLARARASSTTRGFGVKTPTRSI